MEVWELMLYFFTHPPEDKKLKLKKKNTHPIAYSLPLLPPRSKPTISKPLSDPLVVYETRGWPITTTGYAKPHAMFARGKNVSL